MESPLREQFIYVTMRFKRMDFCPAEATCLQQSELAVMAKASAGCMGSGEGVSVSDIQQNLHISKPAVSQTLNSLESKHYIVRRIDPHDRRKITVTLTPEGECALAEAQCSYEKFLNSVLEHFGTENVSSLIELLNRLIDILDSTDFKNERRN